MNVVYPTCCGVDVHKSFLAATIIKTLKDSLQPNYQKKRFSTFNSDLKRFADWLHKNDCLWFNILKKRDIHVVVANPKWVKAVKGNRDDTKDSRWIGDLFRLGLVKSSFIPSRDSRILRKLTRYHYKLTCMKSSKKNRFQNAFTVCLVWIWLSSVLLSAYAAGLVLPLVIMNLPARKSLSVFHVPEFISNLCWYGLPTQP